MKNKYFVFTFSGQLTNKEKLILTKNNVLFSESKMISGDNLIDVIIMASPVIAKYIKDILIEKIKSNSLRKFRYGDLEFNAMNSKEIKKVLKFLELNDLSHISDNEENKDEEHKDE